jgi:diguanylate cyclase (GGDEF)-like protein/PAS domain S-box-containing protein
MNLSKHLNCFNAYLNSKYLLLLLLVLTHGYSYALGNKDAQRALEPVNLQLKWHHQFQFAGYYAAKAQGFYEEEGLNVNIIEGGKNKSATTLVSNNVVQYGVSDSEILLDYINGKPLVVLGAIFQHSPYILLSREDANIRTPSDLVGKRIMLGENQGAAQIKAILKHEDIQLSQITILPHSWNIEDLIQHKVDAVSAYLTAEPNFLKAKGITPSILNSTNYGVDFYGDTLFTSQKELKNHPERVAAFLRASRKGWEYALEHQEATAELILKLDGVKNRGITKAILLEEAKSMEPLILHDVVEIGHINPWRWKHIADEFVGLGYIKKDYDLSNFIYHPHKASPALSKQKVLLILLLVMVIFSLIGVWFYKQRRSLDSKTQALDTEVIRRQEAEIKLQKSQDELNEVFKKTAAGIVATDINGNYLLVNPAFCKMLGYTEEELLKKDFASVTYQGDLLINQHEVQKIIDGLSNDFTIEKQYIKKDGTLVWARASVSAVRNANNEIDKLIAVTEDITEKIETDSKLKQSESLLRIAGNLAKLGGWDIDLKTMKMRWSDEVAIMHDLAPGNTPSFEDGLLMISPEYRNHIKQVVDDCIHLGKSYDEEFQKITAKDRLIWVRSVGNAVKDEHDNTIRIEGAFQEITAYKNLEIFNRKQSSILEDIASGAPLVSVLEACVKLIEDQYPDLTCAVNFIDEQGLRLKTGTSFNLPTEYLDAIDGLAIGDSVGSCGTAAYHQKEVIVTDIATSPLWQNYKEFALKHQLLACWSWPLISSKNKVIGTFAAYSRAISEPTEEEIKLIRLVAKTAAIAIEKERASDQIRLLESAIERLDDIVLITEAQPIGNQEQAVVFVNEAFERRTGFDKTDILGKSPRLLQGPNTQKDELIRINAAINQWQAVRAELINYKKSGEEFWLELEITPISNQNGEYTHWVSVQRDITLRKESELEMARLNRALRMLSSCNDVLIRATDELALINSICKLAVETGGYRMAWVGYAEDDLEKSIIPIGSYGSNNDDFLNQLQLSWSENHPRGIGPGGNTIRSGKTVIISDIADDYTYPAIKEAISNGYLGLVSLPLNDKGKCFGLLIMYVPEVRAITEEEIKLLEELAEDLSFGIINIRGRVEQERVQSALIRVAASVSSPTNNQFFMQLVENIAIATDTDAAFIAQIMPNEPQKARTIAAMVDGAPLENIEYNIVASPCKHLLESEHFVLSNSITECFNPSESMTTLGMKDYVGQRLVNNKGIVIGMVFVLKRETIKQSNFIISTLKIFATRIAAEIERQDYDRHISVQASLLDKAQDAIIVRDMQYRIQFWNQGAERLYGWTQEEALGKSIADLIYSDNQAFYEADRALLTKNELKQEIKQYRKDGSEIFAEVHLTLVKDDSGQPLSVLCINTDISERKIAAEKIQYLAFYDALTGLPNRLLLQDRLQHALATSVRNYKYGALLFIDIDNFKTINDTIGHSAGDILLKKIGERFVASTRQSDTVARLGGDEFIILLEEITTDAADAAIHSQTFAEKLIKSFKQPFEIGDHLYHSSPSIGVTLFQGEQQSVDELLKQADLAMYQAKAAGRNTLRFYDPQMQTAVTNRVQLENDLREGIKKNEFILHYQPQFNHLNQCIGAEALVRWKHSTKGMISPVEFIPLAEETQLIIPIGNWVLKTACETLVRWQAIPQLANISLAVNISVNQFRQPDFVMQVRKIIKRSSVNPTLLELELTESLFAENIDDITHKMTALKKLGIKFSLDDFGTGYSSLNYLKRLPLNQLKIDQSFVRDILVDSHDASICRSIITLANSLDLEVIAEGVENLDQKELLYQQGCNSYQGYYFSKPLPIDALEAFITKKFDSDN